MRRIVSIVLGVLVALVAIGVVVFVVVVNRAQPSQPGSFYALPSPLPQEPPGTIIRSEPLNGLPVGTEGWKILYMSTSYTGKPTAVSGMVIVPKAAR